MVDKIVERTGREIYEDQFLIIRVPSSAAVKGHVRVIPRRKITFLSELNKEETEHFFKTCSYAATLVFELVKAHGTNIIVNENQDDKEEGNKVWADIIARKNDDPLDFTWDRKSLSDQEMEDSLERIKDKVPLPGYEDDNSGNDDKKPKQKAVEKKNVDEKVKAIDDKENYLIKQLIRIP